MELEPVVMVGKDGVKETVITALDEALHVHELVKVRFVSHKDEVEPFSRELEEKTHSVLVAVTGFTAVYFRQDEEDRSKRIYHI
jgi:Predicted RNA-binding protein containing KH domain, possibly ribosomal protein